MKKIVAYCNKNLISKYMFYRIEKFWRILTFSQNSNFKVLEF